VGQGLLIIEDSRSHSHTPHLVEFHWTSGQLRCRELYLKTHHTHNRQTLIPPAGFEPAIPGTARPQNYVLPLGQRHRQSSRSVPNIRQQTLPFLFFPIYYSVINLPCDASSADSVVKLGINAYLNFTAMKTPLHIKSTL
jgi:hypothetical protein